MAQSLSNVLLHLVFSTKHRRPWINVELDEELAKYEIEFDERYVWD